MKLLPQKQIRALATYVALFAVVSQASFAATRCTITSVSPVNFGVYDVFSTAPNDDGIGGLTIDCGGAGNTTFVVALSTGQSNSYASRVMKTSSGIRLNYNLYTDATRGVVWGDGTSSSQTMTFTKNKAATLNIFGRIPSEQDVPIGIYSDNITAIVNF